MRISPRFLRSARAHRHLLAPILGLAVALLLSACEPEEVRRYGDIRFASSPDELEPAQEPAPAEDQAPAEEPGPAPDSSMEEIIRRHFGDVASQAMKIVECESNFDPNAVSQTNDHGLFQINQVHRRAFPDVTGQPWSAVYDPEWNSVYAKYLYDREGWRPWSCRRVL